MTTESVWHEPDEPIRDRISACHTGLRGTKTTGEGEREREHHRSVIESCKSSGKNVSRDVTN